VLIGFIDNVIYFANGFAQFGIEVVFNEVVGSKIIFVLPSCKTTCNQSPFVSKLIVQLEQIFFLFLCEIFDNDGIVQMVVVSDIN
jgi:hypothetical protein